MPALDALRGAALLPVAVVNLLLVSAPTEWTFSRPFASTPDPRALQAVFLLFAGKGYPLLALLLGAGIALQAGRAEALGLAPGPLLRRRLAGLGAIGLAHAFLVWSGDVLVTYAAFGFLLLAFLGRRPRTLAVWAGALLAVNAAFLGAASAAAALAARAAPEAFARFLAAIAAEEAASVSAALAAYGEGSWTEAFVQRAREFLPWHLGTIGAAPQILALLLVGAWAVRRGLVRDPAAHRPFLLRAAMLLVPAGAAGEVLAVALLAGGTADFPRYLAGQAVHVLSAPALAIGVAATVLASRAPGVLAALRLLAPLGRTALTAYLAQSLLFTALFHGFGLGLYGRVAAAGCLAIAVPTWLGQALAARWWLSRFRAGPAEALWRRLTYGRLDRALPAPPRPATDGPR
jgi:uncharacterized protein